MGCTDCSESESKCDLPLGWTSRHRRPAFGTRTGTAPPNTQRTPRATSPSRQAGKQANRQATSQPNWPDASPHFHSALAAPPAAPQPPPPGPAVTHQSYRPVLHQSLSPVSRVKHDRKNLGNVIRPTHAAGLCSSRAAPHRGYYTRGSRLPPPSSRCFRTRLDSGIPGGRSTRSISAFASFQFSRF